MLLRDPIHGDIELSPLETTLLDLPVMQRLRGIKQLGTAYLVYPGALHTRFDHSIGVCAVAHRIVEGLRRAGQPISAEEEAAIGAAALLHDVTHIPFGHTLEDERRLFPRHDKGSRLSRILAGELGHALAAQGLKETVAGLLDAAPLTSPHWMRDIVSGAIDADLLDYLRRDSFFAGLSHDYDDRIFRAFAVHDDRLVIRLVKHGMDRPDARSEIIRVLRLRYFLTERVYYHHTKVVAGAMISKAVELALDHGLLREEDFLSLNDWTLLERLQTCGLPQAEALAQRVQRRALLKRAYVVSSRSVPATLRTEWVARHHASRSNRAAAEREIAHALGLPFEDVVLYCPALTVMKEAAVPIENSRGLMHLNHPDDEAHGEIQALQDRYAGLWRFFIFVPEAAVAKAGKVCEALFGIQSEHR
ncbi:HD domain-containing protein [Candidatus Dactylopiibacterium carminicum]|nr:HD domain-containing protein [Candidatus Dactylopiibacterium carminicum]